MSLEILLWLHVIGATVLLGTGSGIAFFMVMAVRTRNPALIAHVAGVVVIADALFTATAVVVQPLTGVLLARWAGWSLREPWLATAIALYVITVLCWLPVVWIQARLRDLARVAVRDGAALPARFWRLFRIWVALGFPACAAVVAILWLMLAKHL